MPSETRFAEVKRMLESAGYRLGRIRGSHHTFTKPGASPVVVPVHHGKVKPYYVRQIKKLVQDD
ncbi:MAG TPA: type II toxin-antitoxin system HicA family toxin [Pirellulales bacterium]|jgi:predicted RNA binding protein YcfA (HicA-like mRNA interferase family)|nr:type II toxin-antitoxin system HicA family toxin [Pirellulales bacterium]